MKVTPYLNFDGRAEEALNFYKDALGAEIGMVMRFKDAPPDTPTMGAPPADKIMHSRIKIGETIVFASDGRCGGAAEHKGFTLSLDAKDDADATRLFDALSPGGRVTMPLSTTFFATSFGMLTDKFGVPWIIIAEKAVAK